MEIVEKEEEQKREGGTTCDECGKRISEDEWFYCRGKYELHKPTPTSKNKYPYYTAIEETHLCMDCAPPRKSEGL